MIYHSGESYEGPDILEDDISQSCLTVASGSCSYIVSNSHHVSVIAGGVVGYSLPLKHKEGKV